MTPVRGNMSDLPEYSEYGMPEPQLQLVEQEPWRIQHTVEGTKCQSRVRYADKSLWWTCSDCGRVGVGISHKHAQAPQPISRTLQKLKKILRGK